MELEQYSQVKTNVKRLLNIDLNQYKDEQMRRRLDAWLVRVAAPSWNEYFNRLAQEPGELLRFRNYLTINVSEFFRDIERWKSLRNEYLPALLRDSRGWHPAVPGLRAWSCGCSLGQEAYSLAMLLGEIAPGVSHTLLATDIDQGALAVARARGPYPPDQLVNVTPVQKEKGFEPGGPPYFVRPAVARLVTIQEQNMLTDPFQRDFDLIICRNVIIYFTQAAKDDLYRKFYDALRPGGILFLGGTEIIPSTNRLSFRSLGYSFYVKE